MDLDEILFTKFSKYFRKRNKEKDPLAFRRVHLQDIVSKLTLIARAFSGYNIEIFPAEVEGGYKDLNFFLPKSMDLFEDPKDNLKYYFYRIVYLTIQQKQSINWSSVDADPDLLTSRTKAKESSTKVLSIMEEEYPQVMDIYQNLHTFLANNTKAEDLPLYWLYGKWMKNSISSDGKKTANGTPTSFTKPESVKPETILKARAVEEIRSIQVDKKQQEDYVLTHNFEKVETAEEFNGTWRDFDGDDDLKDHHEALEELSMKLTVRVDDQVHSVYQAEFIENTSIAESNDRVEENSFVSLPEWDYRSKTYKIDYCKVYPVLSEEKNASYYDTTIKEYGQVLGAMRKMLTNYNNKRKQIRRQTDGQEFDLDAIIDLYADVHSGKTPSDRIYLSSQKKEKDLSILLLLDSSLSSDGYSAGNRVIDVEKQVSIIFGEILNEFNVDFSVADFHSSTRNYITYRSLKDFDEPWHIGKLKIGASQPSGYTRIGGAIRYASAQLRNRQTANKWIILLSDGKPNDYDKYEGKYGVQDVKQALREANECHINSYALAIEAQAKYYLPQMFGQNHYQILSSPVELISSMVRLFEKIHHG
ncbi:MAG: VWA domain-containing protein [Saprospiraceae bacterium]|nr:VWA domain-containing protein [Saprospiraceae bacterium]